MNTKYLFRWKNLCSVLAVCATFVAPLGAFGADVGVNIVNFSFQPASVDVQSGDTVTWTQKDTTRHTSTSDSGLWDSPLLSVTQTFSRTFDAAGTFPYHCTPHTFMTGSVNVQGAPANQPPTISIQSPANDATFTAPATLSLQANASDSDGSVSSVEFFAGNTSLGTAGSSPFTVAWNNVAAGSYTLTARATDNTGASTISDPVHITVNPATVTAPTLSAPTKTEDGKFQFTVQGTAGRTYVVQVSGDFLNWDVAQTLAAPSDTFTVTDTPPANLALRYYRVQVQP
jgi:plastocyanin